MRILLVCPYFPPENTIAALRIAKFAEYWAEAGHEVIVLARAAIRDGVEPPVHARIRVIRVRDPLERAAKLNFAVSTSISSASASRRTGLIGWMKAAAKKLIWPDVYGPWGLRARRVGIRSKLAPDVVVGSVGPFTALLVARTLSKHYRVPLVIDYRDLLTANPFYSHGRVRRAIDSSVEHSAVTHATLLAAVSEPMAQILERTHGVPTVLVRNGYDPRDFEGLSYEPPPGELHVVYCGTIYPGLSDPRVILEALRVAHESEPAVPIRLDLYGRNISPVVELAGELGVGEAVTYFGEVTHAESLRVQSHADALLIIMSPDPRTKTDASGKIYEYIGAGRPIVMIGFEGSAAAKIVRDHDLGLVSNTPAELAEFLCELAREKSRNGRVRARDGALSHEFTRQHQSGVLLAGLESITTSS